MFSKKWRPVLGAGFLLASGLHLACDSELQDSLMNPGGGSLFVTGTNDPGGDPGSDPQGGDSSSDPTGTTNNGGSTSTEPGTDPGGSNASGSTGGEQTGGEQTGGGTLNVTPVDTRPVTLVTNLEDTDYGRPLIVGSIRWALANAPTPGIIRFAVGGPINLKWTLSIKRPDLEIDGSTAPGGGITFQRQQFDVRDTHDIVLRHLRFRSGDGFVNDADRVAAHGQYYDVHSSTFSGGQRSLVILGEYGPCRNVRIENCSIQNSTDDNGVVAGDCAEVTFFRCLFSGGYTQLSKGLLCYGMPGGPVPSHPQWVTVQQCLFVNQWARMPDMAGETVHLVNNVILRPMQGGRLTHAKANVVGNCLFTMPNHPWGPNVERVLTMVNGTFSVGALFISDNLVDGLFGNASNVVGISNQGSTPLPLGTFRADPFPQLPADIVSAPQALMDVLTNAGCSGPGRDEIDLTEIDRAAGFVGINPTLVR